MHYSGCNESGPNYTNSGKPPSFTAWAKHICEYLSSLPGEILHVVFDVYSDDYDFFQPPKGRPEIGKCRFVPDLSQKLPKPSEWAEFLSTLPIRGN